MQDSNLFQASVGGEDHNGVEPLAMLQDVQRQSHLRRPALPLEEPNVSLKVLPNRTSCKRGLRQLMSFIEVNLAGLKSTISALFESTKMT